MDRRVWTAVESALTPVASAFQPGGRAINGGLRLRPAPLSKLLPRLHQFLHGAWRREGLAIDDAAFAVGTFVEFANAVFAEQREVAHDLFQILAAPNFFFLAGIRAACHKGEISIFAFYSPTNPATNIREPGC